MQSLTSDMDTLHSEYIEITGRLQDAKCMEVCDDEERGQGGYGLEFELSTSQE
jgi:hypothetical protein